MKALAIILTTIMMLAGAAEAQPRKRVFDANGELAKTIRTINYKLRRYVHRTGKCIGATEKLATYYWQGKRTANGERFRPHGMTAASRTLPFGTRLHIRNPANDRTVTVRINDRGPYTIADIDLSLGAARALGLKQSAYLCVERLTVETPLTSMLE